MVITKNSTTINSFSQFFKYASTAIPSFNTMVANWMILASYKDIDKTSLRSDYISAASTTNEFILSYQKQLDNLNRSMQPSYIDKLNSIYSSSLCTYFASESLCSPNLPSTITGILSRGLEETLQYYIQIGTHYAVLIEDTTTTA